MKTVLSSICSTLALGAIPLLTQPVFAQSFPTRIVTIVAAYPPGGLIDIMARIIQSRMQVELG